MIDKQKALAALEAHQGQYKGLSASVVAGCIQVIQDLPEEDILSGEELAKVACTLNLLKDYQNIGAIDHLRELVQTEKDGRLVVLPCKVGDKVWTNRSVKGDYLRDRDRPYPCDVVFIGLSDTPFIHVVLPNGRMLNFFFEDIGKTVFLTREEAEAALKGDNENA